MNQLAVLLCIVVAQCVAKKNVTTDVPLFCEEYANCLAKANQKSAECLEENTTAIIQNGRKRCAGAADLHAQLQALYDERNAEVETCVREQAESESVFSQRKIDKCKLALKKSKRSVDPLERRMKRKDRTKERKEKPKSCTKEAKKMRMQCAKIAKCCSAVKSCQDSAVQKKEILEKKKQLKGLYHACHADILKKKLNRKQNGDKKEAEAKVNDVEDKKTTKVVKKRSRLNEKVEESQERKRRAPIQTKVLQEVSEQHK
ncbi:unnamed protein product [Haemonchus placei]|uniref:Axoneme-associated protein mst101(2)-like n=1 Tax=Haemonchus placei TaxID=6290 RepID=A0A0N4WBX9_HAEPC|nr:unnamed protein product [Haemonchus placei]